MKRDDLRQRLISVRNTIEKINADLAAAQPDLSNHHEEVKRIVEYWQVVSKAVGAHRMRNRILELLHVTPLDRLRREIELIRVDDL